MHAAHDLPITVVVVIIVVLVVVVVVVFVDAVSCALSRPTSGGSGGGEGGGGASGGGCPHEYWDEPKRCSDNLHTVLDEIRTSDRLISTELRLNKTCRYFVNAPIYIRYFTARICSGHFAARIYSPHLFSLRIYLLLAIH